MVSVLAVDDSASACARWFRSPSTGPASMSLSEGKAAGAAGWIEKPFNPDQLRATV